MADGPEKSPPGVDSSVANEARVYDYYLGGKDNFEVDRAVAEATMAVVPDTPILSRDNRDFTRRATAFLAESGIRQFLDLGSGLPTSRNIHEVAQDVDPSCRVVYVDYDPVVLAHGRALLATNDNTTVVTADLREPDEVLGTRASVACSTSPGRWRSSWRPCCTSTARAWTIWCAPTATASSPARGW